MNNRPYVMLRLLLLLCVFPPGIYGQSVDVISNGNTLYCYNTYDIDIHGFSREQKKVSIQLFKHGTLSKLIAPSASRNFKYRWYVDGSTEPGDDYVLKITGQGEKPLSCMSRKFSLEKPEIKITSPAAGDKWVYSDSALMVLKWESPFFKKQHFKIVLMQGDEVSTIMSPDANCLNVFYKVFAPDLKIKTGQNYRVRVSLVADSGINAYSAPFRIYRKSYKFNDLNGIPLVWLPGENVVMTLDRLQLAQYCRAVFSVAPFTDERADTTLIGENIEEDVRGTVTTNESVAAWCSNIMADFLGKQKIRTAEMAVVLPDVSVETSTNQFPLPLTENYSVRIAGSILEFFVTESSTYRATILMEFSLTDNSGKLLWKNIIKSTTTNWGSSYQATNYYETISNAYADVIVQLFSDPKVIGILRSN